MPIPLKLRVPLLVRRRQPQGFALVIALSLMAFVLLLLLSITTLVQIESKGAQTQMQRMAAEQAALLSLNLAIGKLQETAGLDQRVTAPAEAAGRTEVGAKQLTGVWRSWEGLNHQENGLPIAPVYASKSVTGDQEIASTNTGRFLGWLVSSTYDSTITPAIDFDSPPVLTEVPDSTVVLVGEGSVGPDSEDREVHVRATEMADGNTAVAWWISGENTKALLTVPEVSSEVIELSQRLASSTEADPNVFDIPEPYQALDEEPDYESQLDLVADRRGLDLLSERTAADPIVSEEYFHDLTAHSRGLLTNTATGGWRRDLSLMSEQWDEMPDSDLPLFTLSPGVETTANKFASLPKGLIYPWSSRFTDPEEVEEDEVASGTASVSSWDSLMDYMNFYKKLEGDEGSVLVDFDPARDNTHISDDYSVHLILARIVWLFAYYANEDSSGVYEPRIVIRPIITLWNPYNVALRIDERYKIINYATVGVVQPLRLKFTLDGNTIGTYNLAQLMAVSSTTKSSQVIRVNTDSANADPIWKPGEVRVFSMAGESLDEDKAKLNVALEPGLRIGSGRILSLPDKLTGSASGEFKAEVVIPDEETQFAVNFDPQDAKSGLYNANYKSIVSSDQLTEMWSDNEITNSGNLGDLAADDSPFLIASYGLRLINAIGDTDNASIESKGVFETSPTSWSVSVSSAEQRNPFDWLFLSVNDWGDSRMPTSDGALIDGSDEPGYIGSGSGSDEGLPRLVVAELPTRPLTSLGQLQHYDHANCNPNPPHFLNPIGNSHASSQIAADAVYSADTALSDAKIVSYDHSYVGNHVLFDDWFVSSIAPEMESWSKTEDRDAKTVYKEFISAETVLPNRAYRPAVILSEAEAVAQSDSLFSDSNADAWHDVASEIEVEGMFNINSTSVSAWTALLRNMYNEDVPELSITENSWDIGLTSGEGQPVSRTTIAGPSNASGNYANILATHKRLSEVQITALAEAIVEQVKLRGPFLSLSEFVNRRLVANTSPELAALAKSGALEAALESLSTLGDVNENPYAEIQKLFGDSSEPGIVFPEAAEGNVAYAFPGWIRQADILRPIAPVISARDDTFVIRAYGESRNRITGGTDAGAWCEAVVQRRADYVDTIDEASVLPSDATLTSEINKRFGRRFSIVSFRWLSPDEV
ncbi:MULTISPECIES: hypothetical protein [unclassified Lentimonas]|uniref:hypothetical protein n=1 Tax=unclassified Lentimonas TaxID=2630993 RepID=UPI00132BE169|nr:MULTISPECIES: hypothetical protein [unclassified Lentimonas]CAA6680238.1 Unannotated [Lentimonas sp. CC4]CAA6687383.1 Unannotated [Lentimonas sp. CC6]CAA7076750.1 Unannotated [Lentimonas sp. CC4]CAA7171851.1 Unannotated [Lentimonas sp. CC21]CAA7183580.1 Unannotated [Lentimonas sp. CC8]